MFARRRGRLHQRIPLYWNRIDPTAIIHPTAVIEGAVIGAGTRIGAGCVVRYSVLGNHVHLHDGAKVEYSAVDDRTWLMHDLVLYRSVAESDVFLIHGPYQFSFFQHASAAFATIMMDYRPDAREITITTTDGPRSYRGRFLGALLEEQSKVFGGTLTAPGITIPAGREVYSGVTVVRNKDLLPGV
jgi:NDP-sugar pyrophosphorylase family protein